MVVISTARVPAPVIEFADEEGILAPVVEGVKDGDSVHGKGNGANVAAVANGFRVGKHTSNTSASRYDLDEFRMVNRVATTDEIISWCAGPKSLYYKFDRGMEITAINYGDDPAASVMVTGGGGAWQSPGRYGTSMLRGSQHIIGIGDTSEQ